MKAAPFEYVRAGSVAEACELLRRDGDDAKLIAGGQSLVPMMAMRLTRPGRLVDINDIAALKTIAAEATQARTGACVRHCLLERDDTVAAGVPLLRQALAWVGHAQIRNRGTAGGSLAHADPAAELPLVAQVLDATLSLRSATRARTVPASGFFTGPLSTALAPDECLEEICWPVWGSGRVGSEFTEVSRRHGDFAIVAACAQVELDADGRCRRAAFGIGGGASTPMAFPALAARLAGTRLEEAVVSGAAHDAAAQTEFSADLHAGADYRRHLAEVLVARVLRASYQRAAGNGPLPANHRSLPVPPAPPVTRSDASG